MSSPTRSRTRWIWSGLAGVAVVGSAAAQQPAETARIEELVRRLDRDEAVWQTCALLEHRAAQAVEVISERLRSGVPSRSTLVFLQKTGKAARPASVGLRQRLPDLDDDGFVQAMWALCAMHEGDTLAATLELAEVLEAAGTGRSAGARLEMIQQKFILGARSNGSDKVSTEELLAELERALPYRQIAILEQLAGQGSAATAALPVLARLVAGDLDGWSTSVIDTQTGKSKRLDYPATIRKFAARAMVRIAPGDVRCAEAFAYLLSADRDPLARRHAIMWLAHWGPEAAVATPYLVQALADADAAVVREAVTTLGAIGPAASAAVPALEAMVDHADEQVRARVQAALRHM